MSFSKMGLNTALQDRLAQLNYTAPTPIQQRAIPVVLEGRDLLAAAQTGTGKTAAFALPILQLLTRDGATQLRTPRALILTPTRELAAQVAESLRNYGQGFELNTTVVFGGVAPGPQLKAFRRGVDILVATPGRLLDHLQQGNLDLSTVEMFVLDEADRMLDMGFIHDIRKVIAKLPKNRQNLLFSATFSGDIRTLAKSLLQNPAEIDVAPRNSAIELVEQQLVYIAKHQKKDFISWLIGANNWRQVLVFTRTKHGANRLCEQLGKDGLPSAALHGNKSQGARTKALEAFKTGKVRVLVATDIAARGIDIEHLPHVINFELPNVPSDYVHRIGRTGRAGLSGEALSLVSMEERPLLKDINKLLGQAIAEMPVEGFHLAEEKPGAQPPKPAQAQRRKPRSNGQNRGRGNERKQPQTRTESRGRGRNARRSGSA